MQKNTWTFYFLKGFVRMNKTGQTLWHNSIFDKKKMLKPYSNYEAWWKGHHDLQLLSFLRAWSTLFRGNNVILY